MAESFLPSFLPNTEELVLVLSLSDYNLRLVSLSVMCLGGICGVIGTIMLLRKQALAGDTISHAMLPGICSAFLLMLALGGSGKFLPGLLLGGLLFGFLGMSCFYALSRLTRLKDDAALGIVLSVFFGAGVALLSVIQNLPQANAAGLESFIYGKTASMVATDSILIGIVSLFCILLVIAGYKEIRLLAFDGNYARAQGWPTARIDTALLLIVILVTVVGLQAVGLILMVALLVIPAASARFWSQQYGATMLLAGFLGGFSCVLGALMSALFPRLPAGAVIVTLNGLIFAVSFLCGPHRGVIPQTLQKFKFDRKIVLQHFLRAAYEFIEQRRNDGNSLVTADFLKIIIPGDAMLESRTWSLPRLHRTARRAKRLGFIRSATPGNYLFTETGLLEAQRLVRNHRLWEMYLINHADVAPSHVDRDADSVEHVLGNELVSQLIKTLGMAEGDQTVPKSPHAVTTGWRGGPR